MNITPEGQPRLGAALGYIVMFISEKGKKNSVLLRMWLPLNHMPHMLPSLMGSCISSPSFAEQFQISCLEDFIQLRALTGRAPPSDVVRELLSQD